MNIKYLNMTNDSLNEELQGLIVEREFLRQQRRDITENVKLLTSKILYIEDLLTRRSKSKYNGEFYVKSPSRIKYGKTIRELDVEERREYNRVMKAKSRKKLGRN